MDFSCKVDSDKRRSVSEPVDWTSHRRSMDFHGNGEESTFEFWPVQHPTEPPEEDRPVECPMPADSSVINGNNKWQQKFCEKLQRNPTVLLNKEKRMDGVLLNREKRMDSVSGEPSFRAARKRHHGEQHMANPLFGRHSVDQFLPSHNITMFRMLNKFNS